MRKYRVLPILLTICLICATFSTTITSATDSASTQTDIKITSEEKLYSTATIDDNFTDDKVMVILSNAASLASQDYNAFSFSEINCKKVTNYSQSTVDQVKMILSDETISAPYFVQSDGKDSPITSDIDLSSFYQYLCLELAEPSKENVLAAIEILERREDVLYAGPNYIYTISNASVNTTYDNGDFGTGIPAAYSLTSTVPNDRYYSDQWAISQINLDDAWNISTSNSVVTIGILDTGIDADHPDIQGCVNETASRDCLSGYALAVSNVTDPNGHGTMVGGVIGATANNVIGVCGVSRNVELISLRIADQNRNSSSSAIMAALCYAHDNGIKIINMSLSYFVINQEIRHYLNNTYNGLVICAAGNNSGNIDNTHVYPACHDFYNIISVGASTSYETRWVGSNYGEYCVDLFAPGAAVYSTMSRSVCSTTNCEAFGYHVGYNYHADSGTSYAAPYVAGVATLIMAKYPSLSIAEVKERILNSVDVSSAYIGYCSTNGRLNAYKALHNHSYTHRYDVVDTSGHNSFCACGVYTFEDHNFSEIGGLWVCSDCGFAY